MKEKGRVLKRGYICYTDDNKRHFVVGEILKIVEGNNFIYIFDISKKMLELLYKKGVKHALSPIFIRGIDLDYGYYQRHSRVPFFINVCTPDRRREDIDEILKKYNLEYYDQFEIMLKTKAGTLDEWRVLRELDSSVVNKEEYLTSKKNSSI